MRRNFLINKPFQFRFMLFVCGAALIGILIQMLTILYFINEMLGIEPVDGVNVSSYFYNFLQTNSDRFLYAFLLGAICFFIFSLIASLFFSHKIAGPLFRLHMYLNSNSSNADKVKKLSFRQGDFFQEIPEDFNKFTAAKNINE